MSDKKDYLAIAYILAGSTYGRSSDRITAINICRKESLEFARPFGGFKPDATMVMMVYDITGHDRVEWDGSGAWYWENGGKHYFENPETVSLNPHKRYPQ